MPYTSLGMTCFTMIASKFDRVYDDNHHRKYLGQQHMKSFNKNIIDIYGHEGKTWLAALPDSTTEFANKYQLTGLQPVSNISFNYVAAGEKNGEPIILKLGLNHKALAKEANCLKAFSNHGAVKVWAWRLNDNMQPSYFKRFIELLSK
jgi:hypothetical protein